jgi:hypothetical protein
MILVFGFLLWTPLQIEQPVSDGRSIPLSMEDPIGQTLLAHFPGLFRISIPAAGIAEDDLGVIQFQLSQLEPGGEITLVQHDEVTISRANDWIHFQFPPQDNEAGTQFAFYLKQTGGIAIHLPAHTEDMYPEGNLLMGDGDLVFQAAFDPPWAAKIKQLLVRLSANKPGLLGGRAVYPLALVLMIASFVGLSWMLIIPLRQPEGEKTQSSINNRDEEHVQS